MKKLYSRRDFINRAGKFGLAGAGAYAATSMLHGCISVGGSDVSSTLSQVAKYSDSAINAGRTERRSAWAGISSRWR